MGPRVGGQVIACQTNRNISLQCGGGESDVRVLSIQDAGGRVTPGDHFHQAGTVEL